MKSVPFARVAMVLMMRAAVPEINFPGPIFPMTGVRVVGEYSVFCDSFSIDIKGPFPLDLFGKDRMVAFIIRILSGFDTYFK